MGVLFYRIEVSRMAFKERKCMPHTIIGGERQGETLRKFLINQRNNFQDVFPLPKQTSQNRSFVFRSIS